MTAGFDRLWVWHLVNRFDLPVLFGHNPLSFFGVLEFAGILLSIALTHQVEQRFDTLQPRRVGRLMLVVTSAIALSIAAFGWSPFLGLALGLYLIIYSLRELTDPLLLAWMNQRLDSDVRATLLSMTGQAEAVDKWAWSDHRRAGASFVCAAGFACLRRAVGPGARIHPPRQHDLSGQTREPAANGILIHQTVDRAFALWPSRVSSGNVVLGQGNRGQVQDHHRRNRPRAGASLWLYG